MVDQLHGGGERSVREGGTKVNEVLAIWVVHAADVVVLGLRLGKTKNYWYTFTYKIRDFNMNSPQ